MNDFRTREDPVVKALNEGENRYRQTVLSQGPLPGYPVITREPVPVHAPSNEAFAKRLAARAVQALADSEPSERTIVAQDRLKGTPEESLFCVSAEELEAVIAVTISNAIYDGEFAPKLQPICNPNEKAPHVATLNAEESQC